MLGNLKNRPEISLFSGNFIPVVPVALQSPSGLSPCRTAALRLCHTGRYIPASARIGGWNTSPVSHGKKIQVSWDTSVMNVSTSGRPIGLA